MTSFEKSLELYAANEGIFFNKKKESSTSKSRKAPISMSEYKSQYEEKLKRLFSLCKSDLSKTFRNPNLKQCAKACTMENYSSAFNNMVKYNSFPSIPVVNYDYWKAYPQLRQAMKEGADKTIHEVHNVIINMINENAKKVGLSGMAVCGGDWDTGSFDFEISANYDGIAKEGYNFMDTLDLANALESYLIDEDEFAMEGVNRDTAKSVKNSSEYRDLIFSMKKTKELEKSYKKTKDVRYLEEELQVCKQILSQVDALKKFIDSQPELDGWFQKVCATLTPSLFNWKFPQDETTGMIYTGTTMIRFTKTYDDDMSKSTNSALKRRYQQGMNLYKKNMLEYIKNLKARIERDKR